MRLTFNSLLLFLALGASFRSCVSQESTEANFTPTLPNRKPAEHTTESVTPGSTIPTVPTEPQPTDPDLSHGKTTLWSTMATLLQTTENTEPTTAESFFETTVQSTETTSAAHVYTTVPEQQTTEALTTAQHQTTRTTASSISPKPTSPTVHPTDFTPSTSTVSIKVTQSLHSTTVLPKARTLSQSVTKETTTKTSTKAPTLNPRWSKSQSETTFSVSTDFSTVLAGGHVEPSSVATEINWLLVIVMCMIIMCVLCLVVFLTVKQLKRKASRTFGPVQINGGSKLSRKKKGMEADAWAGPVSLKPGAECDAEVQEGLLPNVTQEEDDVVLSTFAVLTSVPNGGVGGEGTKEAKKWEAQEPMPFIDEEVQEDAARTLGEVQRCAADVRSEEQMIGGETFCLTTAV